MSKAESLFREAFKRLVANAPINMPKETPVSQNNVAKEAGKHPTALKKDRYPALVLEIQDYVKRQEADSELASKKKLLKKRRTTEEQLADCKRQRDKLASVCEAQAHTIEDLLIEISELKTGKNNIHKL